MNDTELLAFIFSDEFPELYRPDPEEETTTGKRTSGENPCVEVDERPMKRVKLSATDDAVKTDSWRNDLNGTWMFIYGEPAPLGKSSATSGSRVVDVVEAGSDNKDDAVLEEPQTDAKPQSCSDVESCSDSESCVDSESCSDSESCTTISDTKDCTSDAGAECGEPGSDDESSTREASLEVDQGLPLNATGNSWCEACEQAFTDQRALARHYQSSVHLHRVEYLVTHPVLGDTVACPFCWKGLSRPDSCVRHCKTVKRCREQALRELGPSITQDNLERHRILRLAEKLAAEN